MDIHSKETRSYNMSQIKSKNTKPELLLRKALWCNGIRNYRLKNSLPGKPDLYFPVKKVAIFIDGCFWHKCPKCFKEPKSNKEFWLKKIKDNTIRDRNANEALRDKGWIVLRFWEHQIKKGLDYTVNIISDTIK
ncbi:Very short patch repair protein [subsurface metagenome]